MVIFYFSEQTYKISSQKNDNKRNDLILDLFSKLSFFTLKEDNEMQLSRTGI